MSDFGDINSDGYDDFIFGASRIGAGNGFVRVSSGKDGSTIHTIASPNTLNNWFGSSVSGVDDINLDSFPDIIVGAQMANNGGNAYLYSGFDVTFPSTTLLKTFPPPSNPSRFGSSVSDAGDVNGDGIPDIVIGSSLADLAQVFSGDDSSPINPYPLLFTVNPSPNPSRPLKKG